MQHTGTPSTPLLPNGQSSSSGAQSFYRIHSIWSDPGPYRRLFDSLPSDMEALCRTVRNIVLHFRAGPRVGFDIPQDRLVEIDTRRCELILRRVVELADRPLQEPRTAPQRIIGCCRDASLLLCSMLRHQDVPARVRYGFAPYLGTGSSNGDHAVVEYWNGERWSLADPEQAQSEIAFGSTTFSPLDIPVGAFLPAGIAWQLVREGRANAETFSATPDFLGLPLIRLALLIDIAMQNKNETLLWDVWGMAELSHQSSAHDLAFLDRAAMISAGIVVEATFAGVRHLFTDERIRLPPTITSLSPVQGPVEVRLDSLG